MLSLGKGEVVSSILTGSTTIESLYVVYQAAATLARNSSTEPCNALEWLVT
jgi:hypothetical protein